MQPRNAFRNYLIIGLLALITTACGGGDDEDDDDDGFTSASSSGVARTIGGSVSGLSGTLKLSLNGGADFTINASGSFTFPTTVVNGSSYAISITALSNAQVCGVANATGTASANVTNVTVTCAGTGVGGTVSGLTGSGLVMELGSNSATDVAVTTNGAFTFTTGLPTGVPPATTVAPYFIQIKSQPSGQTCTIVKATGVVTVVVPTNVNSAAVVCVANDMSLGALSGTYKVTTSGFTGRAFVTFFNDGSYVFATHSNDSDCSANNGDGVEYGVYRWNQTTHDFAFVNAVVDTNGDCGMANGSVLAYGTIVKNIDGSLSIDVIDTDGSNTHILLTATPVASPSGSLLGSWSINAGLNQSFQVFSVEGSYSTVLTAIPQAPQLNGQAIGFSAGIEDACFAFASGSSAAGSFTVDFENSCAVNAVMGPVDTNGGASGPPSAVSFTVTGNTLQTTVVGGGPNLFTRNVNN